MQSLVALKLMARSRPRTLQHVLDGQRLQQFADFTEQHKRWQQQLRDCFHVLQLSPLSEHCQVLNVRAQTLIMQVSSAAIATRLKMQQSRIITYFRNEAMLAVERLELRIAPAANQPPAEPRKQSATSDSLSDTVKQLREQAEQCEEPLRSQLLALAAKYEK
ncbi:hypothetical protein CWE22_06320 [Pseudidiomarina aestuarii]|uniref:DUF721 domain-containing protein n=2 Tax=Pseudidiomarina aestuarii TaxID=624146 RepID=A0A7Z7EU50_9GAMM|nr:hypothetical protein CWE22_06320 [Pseudidiomarina aestuarii]